MKRFASLLTLGAMIGLLAVAGLACGGDDDDDGDSTPPAASTSVGEGGSSAATLSAEAEDFSFTLGASSVPLDANLDVEFTNNGDQTHTLTFYEDDAYTQRVSGGDSGQVDAGDNTSFTFRTPAEGADLYYRCEIHPTQMQGELSLE